ncbi:MAG: leucine-rich repeat domain-containing protein [Bacteroidales bacterium]|nr:leucine-rich repeat domain-containing protein [Bacteroidales bacterium]
MKKNLLFNLILFSIIFLYSCNKDNLKTGSQTEESSLKDVFYASIENSSLPLSKVYTDNNLKILWNAGDHIALYKKIYIKGYHKEDYIYTGIDGESTGSFEKAPGSTTPSGTILTRDYNLAIYPYSYTYNNFWSSNEEAFVIEIPEVQYYKEHSFGIGANPMIAISENNNLSFKNVCGYLSFRLYGDNVSIKSISLESNYDSGHLSGRALVKASIDSLPTITGSYVPGSIKRKVTLICDPAVKIGSTAEDYTDFWFALHTGNIAGGFTITVTDEQDRTFIKYKPEVVCIVRNVMKWMKPLKVIPVEENTLIEFDDDNFKDSCVNKYDQNGDGEISTKEAQMVKGSLSCAGGSITSIKGIEHFTNVADLFCNYNQITSVDLSSNIYLKELVLDHNQISSIDLSNNKALEGLNINDNPITSLDIRNNSKLKLLNICGTHISTLDISKNPNIGCVVSNEFLEEIYISRHVDYSRKFRDREGNYLEIGVKDSINGIYYLKFNTFGWETRLIVVD